MRMFSGDERPAFSDEAATRESLRGWRAVHPRATFREIEDAVEVELHRLRAKLVEELAGAGTMQALNEVPAEERPRCDACGEVLQARGQRSRTLQDAGGQPVHLRRSYAVCPICGMGLFPPR
jgi:hypothetical protein